MDHIQALLDHGATDICLSGGAAGADLEWAKHASALGHKVIHWSFRDHITKAPADQVVRLEDEELKTADGALANAARAIGKSPPHRANVASMLRRNYFQVAWSTSCYAVTVIQEGGKPGGTAWATTMFAQLRWQDFANLYLFDQAKDTWLAWNGASWDRMDGLPPRPSGIWAGIGSRDLQENGREAIRKLMAS